jgi:hypothetical protein
MREFRAQIQRTRPDPSQVSPRRLDHRSELHRAGAEIGAPVSKEESTMNFDIGPLPPTPAAVTVQTIPPTPPPEVQVAMAQADDAYDKLQTGGHQLHFHLDGSTGHVEVQVHDLQGHMLFTVPPSQALKIAADGVVN